MTTVVACAVDGTVVMGADTCTNVYERPILNGAQKIVRLSAGDGDEVLLGVAGGGGLVGVLEAGLKLKAAPGDGENPQPWAHAVAVAVYELARDGGLLDGGQLDGHLILGWRGRLWTIAHSVAIPHPDGRAAIGSGEGPAIGALDVLLDRGVPAGEAVYEAVTVGCRRDRYSEPPIQMELLGGTETGG